jgi:hypothetical protein
MNKAFLIKILNKTIDKRTVNKKNFNFCRFSQFRLINQSCSFFSTNNLNTSTMDINKKENQNIQFKFSDNPEMLKIKKKFDLGIIRRDDFMSYLIYLKNYKPTTEEKSLIETEFLNYYDMSIKKGLVNQTSYNEFLPLVLQVSSSIGIDSEKFWKIIKDQFCSTYHKLGINLVFSVLNEMEFYYSNNPHVLLLKNIYFKNLTRDKVLVFNVETLLNYVIIFKDFHTEQLLIDDIQQLIILLSKDLKEDEKKYLISRITSFFKIKSDSLDYSSLKNHLDNLSK